MTPILQYNNRNSTTRNALGKAQYIRMRLDNFGPVVFFCSHTTYAMFVGGLGLDVFILQGDAKSYNFFMTCSISFQPPYAGEDNNIWMTRDSNLGERATQADALSITSRPERACLYHLLIKATCSALLMSFTDVAYVKKHRTGSNSRPLNLRRPL